ncbi:tetratricopeptide repeat protein [Kitasatospora sp. NPDC101183]|uniref:tetratricopeptide repeat protein n=1 Tax=Kitasatospora sp. NPDC101183 TaxID=3364100 RepID=UPI00381B5301
MERARLVGVTGPGGPGSGYVLGGRLVLTSAHVVGRAGEGVEVFRPGVDGTAGGTVVWCGTPGGRDDAALVLVDETWQPVTGTVRWGRLVTDRPGAACESWGLPETAQRPGAAVEAVQVSGRINPGSGYVGNRYVMDLLQHPPQGSSPWGGASGAAVFCDRLLVGVVASDRADSGHGRLNAVPAYVLHHDRGFRTALARYAGTASGLEAVEFQHLADPAGTAPRGALRSPAALLQAEQRIVPFHGREELIGRLRAWCAQGGFGARLLYGPGGQGKTRLALHLSDLLAAEGWAVLWPRPEAEAEQVREIRHASRPLLVVLDYAETRAEQLAALVEAASEHAGATPLKLLLLARTDADWWQRARTVTRLAQDHLEGASAHWLSPVDLYTLDFGRVYRQAAQAFAAALPSVEGLAHHDWSAAAAVLPEPPCRSGVNTLTLHMTALTDLLETTLADVPSRAAASPAVEDRLLGHEHRYWEQSAEARGLMSGLTLDTLTTALAAAQLIGVVDREQADRLWRRVPALADQTRDRRNAVTAWIAALYPAASDDRLCEGIQPDRLAERLVGRVLDADPMVADRLLADADDTEAARLLSVYSRAAGHAVLDGRLDQRLSDLCTRYHGRFASQIVATAVQTSYPSPLVTALHAISDDSAARLDDLVALNAAMPPSSLRLLHVAARLAQNLTNRYTALAQQDPATYLPDLATSLNSLSNRVASVGQGEEGLAAVEEAVRIRRVLAGEDPDTYLPYLAVSLNNLSLRLRDANRHDAALAAIQEAVGIRRNLARTNPNVHLPDLAITLINLAAGLGEARRQSEGLAALQEATDYYEILAKADPGTYRPRLAVALNNLSLHLRRARRWQEALTAIRRAVGIRRALAETNPDAHLSELANSLKILAGALVSVGLTEEARTVSREAGVLQMRSERKPRQEEHGAVYSRGGPRGWR